LGEVPENGIWFVERLPVPALVLDGKGSIIGTNARFSDLLGYASGELSGRDGFSLVDHPIETG